MAERNPRGKKGAFVRKADKDQKKIDKVEGKIKIQCASCLKKKGENNFYKSKSPLDVGTGRLPTCKECLVRMSVNPDGTVNIINFKELLQRLNRPFLSGLLYQSIEQADKSGKPIDWVSNYFRNMNLPQYTNLTWKDSDKESSGSQMIANIINAEIIPVTDELILKWGAGYSNEEYQAFERKYNFLKNNYTETTSMHTEALLRYIRFSVKEEMSTARGDFNEAKTWAGMTKDAASAAKINPAQLSKADLSDGLTTFGQLSRAVEQAVDIVEILPKLKWQPQDSADFIMWCYINYERDCRGLPLIEYQDIWKFYDARKAEYLGRLSFLKDDPTEKNRENVSNFIESAKIEQSIIDKSIEEVGEEDAEESE